MLPRPTMSELTKALKKVLSAGKVGNHMGIQWGFVVHSTP